MNTRRNWSILVAVGIGIALLITLFSPFASSDPDGLEKVAGDKAFLDSGESHAGPIADYAFPGVSDPRLATGLAGFTGTLLVFAVGYGLIRVARQA